MARDSDDSGSNLSIDTIYEDQNVLVINKPFGVMTHGNGKTDEETIASWFVSKHPEVEGVGEALALDDGSVLQKPGVVHRLDKDTTGILLLVKNQETFEFIKAQFKDRHAQKTYRAFVYGAMKEEEGVIDRPIGRSSSDFRLRSAQRGARGVLRDAITEFKVRKRGDETTYVELYPKTGRTHQLRVHLKAINHQIVADSLYAPKREQILGFKRLALHAYAL